MQERIMQVRTVNMVKCQQYGSRTNRDHKYSGLKHNPIK